MKKQESRQKIAAHLDKLISENLLSDKELLNRLSVYDLRQNKQLQDIDLALIYEVLLEYQGIKT
jgi:hypothetical protein